jgi:hypothetical protein
VTEEVRLALPWPLGIWYQAVGDAKGKHIQTEVYVSANHPTFREALKKPRLGRSRPGRESEVALQGVYEFVRENQAAAWTRDRFVSAHTACPSSTIREPDNSGPS